MDFAQRLGPGGLTCLLALVIFLWMLNTANAAVRGQMTDEERANEDRTIRDNNFW